MNDVVARTAPVFARSWSAEQMLVSSWQMPGGIYAPMMHPWSTGKDVYFNLFLWSAYNDVTHRAFHSPCVRRRLRSA